MSTDEPEGPDPFAPRYLDRPIAEARRTETPRYGITAYGYSRRTGAPTSIMVRLEGEKRWRRLMVWQFSNAGTAFVRVAGVPLIVRENAIPGIPEETR